MVTNHEKQLEVPRARSDARFALNVVIVLITFNMVIIVIPLLYSAWISMHETDVILRSQEFVGLKNYSQLLQDTEFREAIGISLRFTAVIVVLSLLIGLGMAIVLNEDFSGRSFLRAAILIPWSVSEVVTATSWLFIVSPTYGALTGTLYPLGIVNANHSWLTEHTALYWVAVAYVWHIAPLGGLFLLAALQTVPESLYNAARLDRASPAQRFFHVTLPHLKPMILIVLVVVTVEAFRCFDILFSMTRGGPGTSSQIVPMLIFRYTFEISKYGFAAAASYILVAIGVLLTTVYFLLLMRRRRQVKISITIAEDTPFVAPRDPVVS